VRTERAEGTSRLFEQEERRERERSRAKQSLREGRAGRDCALRSQLGTKGLAISSLSCAAQHLARLLPTVIARASRCESCSSRGEVARRGGGEGENRRSRSRKREGSGECPLARMRPLTACLSERRLVVEANRLR